MGKNGIPYQFVRRKVSTFQRKLKPVNAGIATHGRIVWMLQVAPAAGLTSNHFTPEYIIYI